MRGARDRHETRDGMWWTRMVRLTRRDLRGRRSRVVLTPRRWRSSGRKKIFRLRWWQESPVTRESTKETVKTIAQGRPDRSGEPVVTYSYAFHFRIRGCGCIGHPAFPAPSVLSRGKVDAQLGRYLRRGIVETWPRVPGAARHEPTGRREAPPDDRLHEMMRCRTGTHLVRGTHRSRFCEAALHAASHPGHEEAPHVIARSDSSEAIHSFFVRLDGLLRGACHRARIHATRWLAMTVAVWLFDIVAKTTPEGRPTLKRPLLSDGANARRAAA
jgi:hypothetical protein